MLLPYLKLVRVGTLFSPAADVTAGLCLAGLPWSTDAVRAVLASVLVYAAGMVLNDHADRELDARVRPERPLPRGQIAARVALGLGLALMAAGIALAPMPAYHAAMAGLVLAYDYRVKAGAAAGAVIMGTLRGMNLASPAIALTAAWPTRELWIAAACYAIYIIAVTLLGVLEDEKYAKPRTVESVQTAPPLAASLALLAMPEPWPAAAIGFALALAFIARARRMDDWTQAAIRGSMTWLLLGTMLYTGLLCVASGRIWEGVAIGAAVLPARWISRRIALT